MIKKVFISYSFNNRIHFESFDRKLKKYFLDKFSIETSSFVFDFKGSLNNRNMMRAALKQIDNSDLLIAELSYKAIGVGLEAGYAKAKGKKIIYIHKAGTKLSTTVDGISDIRIEYKNFQDLLDRLECYIKNLQNLRRG